MAEFINDANIRGWLHRAEDAPGSASIAIAHGAGTDCGAPLLVAVAEAFASHGVNALRYDLPFRRLRPRGSPLGSGELDREGIRKVARALRELLADVPLYLAGHSYGGRQSSMVAAEDRKIVDALLLLSYPLHPPKQPAKLRTEHFPALHVPALFVHGSRDEFGTIDEMNDARALIPARTALQVVDKSPHSLAPKYASQIVEWFVNFTKG
jgi:predicted alpha/beta-hydrolase family hydrolase